MFPKFGKEVNCHPKTQKYQSSTVIKKTIDKGHYRRRMQSH